MPRISIRPATVEELRAALDDHTEFANASGVAAPEGWPLKREMFEYAADRLRGHPEEAEWLVYLFFEDGVLVGSGGFHGPPVNRTVEIGYEIAPGFAAKGRATAAVEELLDRAAATGAVDAVIGKTSLDPDDESAIASARILLKLGFADFGPVLDTATGDSARQWQRDVQ
ncbi:N-acetyltransferase [Mycobacterium ahvazicum]|uniref:N-acetyltransferase n=1 Tax=Mycobacterium ahvazicum TaxID=1964395 RepID=A0A2K4Y710_9MYCO|nr:GNAT family N-acetyltransferase [Mycobacterium ahvazicum]SOX52579.1 N-acetyltransferase [Mycobacterium ahvazicum]